MIRVQRYVWDWNPERRELSHRLGMVRYEFEEFAFMNRGRLGHVSPSLTDNRTQRTGSPSSGVDCSISCVGLVPRAIGINDVVRSVSAFTLTQ
jgi:hypothetical protein